MNGMDNGKEWSEFKRAYGFDNWEQYILWFGSSRGLMGRAVLAVCPVDGTHLDI